MYYESCRFCGKEIPTHHNDSIWSRAKRVDAQFCSEQCKIDCHNARRKLDRKKAALQKLQLEIGELEKLLAWDYDEEPTMDYLKIDPIHWR
jgi:DNA repair exonuclease SbcCD ATPase subunit